MQDSTSHLRNSLKNRARDSERLNRGISIVIVLACIFLAWQVNKIEPLDLLGIFLFICFGSAIIRSFAPRGSTVPGDYSKTRFSDSVQTMAELVKQGQGDVAPIVNQFLRYHFLFGACQWICLLPALYFVITTPMRGELLTVTIVFTMIYWVITKLSAALLSRTIPQNLLTEFPSTVESIDRGDLAKSTIANSEQLESIAIEIIKDSGQTQDPLRFGMLPIRDEVATEHFFIHGISGSGKSIILKNLLIQAIERHRHDQDIRIFVDDPKLDMVELFKELKFDKFAIINPFDKRGYAWDISNDITNLRHVDEFVNVLFPKNGNHEQYWNDAAKGAVSAVLIYLVKNAPRGWTLRDLLCILRDREALVYASEQTTRGKWFIENFALIEKTFTTVLSQVENRMRVLEPLAASSHLAWKKGKLFSIRDWCDRKNDIPLLLFTRDEDSNDALDQLCRLLFFFFSKAALKGPEVKHPRTWFFIDEARLLADMTELSNLADKGRSKGVTLCLATQGFRDFVKSAERNPEAAPEFASRIPNKALLKCNDKDAEWSAEQFDKVYKISVHQSSSFQTGSSGYSSQHSSSTSDHQTYAVAPFVYKGLHRPSSKNGLTFYVVSDTDIAGGMWKCNMSINDFPPKPSSEHVNLGVRDLPADEVEPIDADDTIRLSLFSKTDENLELEFRDDDESLLDEDDSFDETNEGPLIPGIDFS